MTPVASVLPQPVVSATSSASETTAANPFASFQGLSAKPTASAAPTQGAVQAANPFAGFQGLSSKPAEPVAPVKAAANPFAGFSGLQTGTPQSLVVSAVQGNGLASTSTSVTKTEVESPSDTSNHYKKKMRKLNTSFFNWTKRQMEDHPLSIWKDGIKVRSSEFHVALKFSSYTDPRTTFGMRTSLTRSLVQALGPLSVPPIMAAVAAAAVAMVPAQRL